MEAVTIGVLAGLALLDSTSFGTLGVPIWMLVHPRVRAGKVALYLAAISGFYLVLGLALLAGARSLAELGNGWADSRAVSWAQLVIGILMLAGSFWPDTPWGKRRRAHRESDSHRTRWRDRVVGDTATTSGVVTVALLAGLIETASMLPYLGAIAIISTSALSTGGQIGVLTAYVLLMAVPALVLLLARMVLHERVSKSLEPVDAWLSRHSANAMWWVIGIVGFLLATDAVGRLSAAA